MNKKAHSITAKEISLGVHAGDYEKIAFKVALRVFRARLKFANRSILTVPVYL